MNGFLRKTLSLLLCCACALGLAACGSSPETSPKDASASASPAAVEESAVPELVYTPAFTMIAENSPTVLSAACYDDSGIYAVGDEVVGRKAPDDVEDEYVGQYDIRETRLFYVSNDGKAEMLPGYRPLPVKEAPEDASAVYNFSSTTGISAVAPKNGGGLITLEVLYTNWTDLEDFDWNSTDAYRHFFYEQESWLRELDSTGKELSAVKITAEKTDSLYSDCVLDDDGNVLVAKSTEDGVYSLCGISLSGETVYEIPSGDMINSVFRMPDGSVYISAWGAGMEMRKIDFSSKTLGDAITLPNDAYYIYPGGGDYPLYYTSGSWLFGFNPETGEKEKVLNWMDCDINPDLVYDAHVDADGTIRTLLFDYDRSALRYDISLAQISKQPAGSSEKIVLTLATQRLSYEMREAVVGFNRRSRTTRIAVKDYSEYNTDEDYTAGLTKLTTEVVAGNCPDLLDLNGLPVDTLARKGFLEDLYPYLDADEELDREMYLANVLAGAEIDGKLVYTIPGFVLNTVAGASAIVGDAPGWTYASLSEALRKMPDGSEIFGPTVTRSQVLSTCLHLDLSHFIDWETGKADFSTPEFLSMLEFAKQFPASYDWELFDATTDSEIARIAEGRQMLYPMNISRVDSLMFLDACFNGAPVTFIGYPTGSGMGTFLSPLVGFAMTSSCSDKDAAWSFLRTFFTEKFIKNSPYAEMLPVLGSLLEEQLAEVTTVKYERDDNGSYRLDEKGEKIPQQRYFFADNEVHTAPALSKETAKRFLELVKETTKTASRDESIITIVQELAEPYFAGQKTAEETAKLIQSKVSIYINEQR